MAKGKGNPGRNSARRRNAARIAARRGKATQRQEEIQEWKTQHGSLIRQVQTLTSEAENVSADMLRLRAEFFTPQHEVVPGDPSKIPPTQHLRGGLTADQMTNLEYHLGVRATLQPELDYYLSLNFLELKSRLVEPEKNVEVMNLKIKSVRQLIVAAGPIPRELRRELRVHRAMNLVKSAEEQCFYCLSCLKSVESAWTSCAYMYHAAGTQINKLVTDPIERENLGSIDSPVIIAAAAVEAADFHHLGSSASKFYGI